MNIIKRLSLTQVLVFLFLCAKGDILLYEHPDLHLYFTIDTSTKEATIGNSIYLEDDDQCNAICLPDLNDSWWDENPQTNYWMNLDIPSTITCEGKAYVHRGYFNDNNTYVEYWDDVDIGKDTYTVTKVARKAFFKSPRLQSIQTIKLPDTIREIGESAFAWCIYLRSINIPSQVTAIKTETFWYCKNIEKIELPDNIRTIESLAFADCESLKEINIPGKCVSIGNDAFKWCPQLHKMIIENGTEPLEVGYCYNLGLNDGRINPKEFKRALFADCSIDSLYLGRNILYPRANDNKPLPPFESTLLYMKSGSYYYNATPSYKKLEFGETLTEIADSLFYNADLEHCDLVFSEGLKRIGKDAFYWNIIRYIIPRKIEIPHSVEYIGENAFRSNYLSEVIIHEGLTTIGKNAFSENNLTEISVPGTVISIGDYAFDKNNIVDVELSNGVQTIGFKAFGSNNIKELTIPESVINIDSGFDSSLINVYCHPITPPSSSNPFSGATIYVPTGTGTLYRNQWGLSSRIIDTNDNVITVNVKTAGTLYSRLLAQDYQLENVLRLKLKGTLNNDDYSTINNMTNLYDLDLSELNMEELPNGFFNNNTQLTKIVFPNTLRSIEDNAFTGCTHLVGTIIIPENCSSIGRRAFYGLNIAKLMFSGTVNIQDEAFMNCALLKEVNLTANSIVGANAFSSTAFQELSIPANLKIGDNAFNIETLIKVTLEGGGQEIGDNAFGESVERYTFNGSVKEIGTFASEVNEIYVDNIYTWCTMPFTHPVKANNLFINNEEANNIIIPEDVKSLRKYMFYECSSIQSVKLHNGIKEIPDRAFKGCINLTSVSLPTTLLSIGDFAFADCTNIKTIVLPSSLKTLGNSAFQGCSSITGIVLPENLQSMGEMVMSGCSLLEKIDLPSSIKNIGENAFQNTNLTTVIAHWKEPIAVPDIGLRYEECTLSVPINTSQKYVNAGWILKNISENGILKINVNDGGRIVYDSNAASGIEVQYLFKPYKSFYISIIPNDGYSLKRIRRNGEVVTSEVEDGKLFFEEPEEDFDIIAVFSNNNIVDGDANGDGVIDNKDVIDTTKHILKDTPSSFYKYSSDMNEDEIINIADVLLIISKINSSK